MCRVRNMSELTLHQKQMKGLADANARLQQKLKECRTIMRQHGIGDLYPGTTAEHERNVEIASRDPENYYALQQVAWHNAGESEAWKRIAHNIHGWLQMNFPEIVLEMPEGIFNPVIAMDFDIKKFLADKKGETINGESQGFGGLLANE